MSDMLTKTQVTSSRITPTAKRIDERTERRTGEGREDPSAGRISNRSSRTRSCRQMGRRYRTQTVGAKSRTADPELTFVHGFVLVATGCASKQRGCRVRPPAPRCHPSGCGSGPHVFGSPSRTHQLRTEGSISGNSLSRWRSEKPGRPDGGFFAFRRRVERRGLRGYRRGNSRSTQACSTTDRCDGRETDRGKV